MTESERQEKTTNLFLALFLIPRYKQSRVSVGTNLYKRAIMYLWSYYKKGAFLSNNRRSATIKFLSFKVMSNKWETEVVWVILWKEAHVWDSFDREVFKDAGYDCAMREKLYCASKMRWWNITTAGEGAPIVNVRSLRDVCKIVTGVGLETSGCVWNV